jgi:hypothetical protein
MKSDLFHRLKSVPPLVRVILTQAARKRATGDISAGTFASQISRLELEELKPKGLNLIQRDLAGGRTRFLIKQAASGEVCDMLDFAADGMIEMGPDGDHFPD